jgi:HEAT repeat protein
MKPAEAAFTIQRAADQVVVAAGFSMHRNGYIREIAANALAATGDKRAIPWLTLRSGDWVDQVRGAAMDGLRQFLSPANAAELVEVLPLLDGGRFGRGRAASDLPAEVERVLELPESAAPLRSGVYSAEKLTRRAAVRLLLRHGSSIDLLRDVMATNDVVAVALVASSIPTDGPANTEAGGLLHSSPVARFRSQGLWRLTRDPTAPESKALVRQALFDKAPSVRDVAQRWVADHEPENDVNDYYRDRLARDPLSALRGLGDHASEVDAALATSHLNDDAAAVRLAALRLLARLGRQSDRDLFVDRFLKGSAKERREALAGLRRSGGADIVGDAWKTAAAVADPAKAKRVLFQLVPMADRWLRISIGLQATANSDPDIAAAGVDVLHRTLVEWNRGYPTKPTIEAAVLREQFEDARPMLQPRNRRRFRWGLEAEVESLLPTE